MNRLVVLALVLVSAIHLGTSTFAQDPLVKKAVGRIQAVENGEARLPSGDSDGATKLLRDLAWAQKRLGAVVQQTTAEWKAAAKRHDAVQAKLVAKRDGPAPKPSGGGSGVGGSGTGGSGTGKGGTPPAKTPPAKTPPKTQTFDRAKLVQLNQAISQAFDNLKILQIKHFADQNRVNGLRRETDKFHVKLDGYPASNADVKLVAGNLANYEALIKVGIDRVAADRDAAPAIVKRLDALSVHYDRKNIPARLGPPFEEEQLRTWARDLIDRRDVQIPRDLDWLDSISGNVIVPALRVSSMQGRLQGTWLREIGESERIVREISDGIAADCVSRAEFLFETDPKNANHVQQRVLGRGVYDEHMTVLRRGEHAVAMARVLDVELARADAPNRAAQAKLITDGAAHLDNLVRETLAAVRLPDPVSTDAALLKFASETLKRKDYEVAGWERLVISQPKVRRERREAWIAPGASRATISFYDYVWEEYEVTTAEKIGDEIWLFANTLKRFESGDTTTTVDKWILGGRYQLTPILAANLDR